MRGYSRSAAVVAALGLVGALAGCAYNERGDYRQSRYGNPPAQVHQGQVDRYGTLYGSVIGIDAEYAGGGGSTSGVGAVAGGALGGVVGNQIGGGSGRALATIAGVVVGAIAGNAIEGETRRDRVARYHVTVRLDDGAQQVYTVPDLGDLRRGDRVRIYQGQITRM